MGQHILLSLQFIQQRLEIVVLVVGRFIQLADLPVHVFDQPLVPLGEFDFRVQILGRRPAHSKKAVAVFGMVDIGDDADARLELIQLDQLVFELIDLSGEFLDLLSLMKHLFGLQGEVALQSGLVGDIFMN